VHGCAPLGPPRLRDQQETLFSVAAIEAEVLQRIQETAALIQAKIQPQRPASKRLAPPEVRMTIAVNKEHQPSRAAAIHRGEAAWQSQRKLELRGDPIKY